jgi:hypothetical protein
LEEADALAIGDEDELKRILKAAVDDRLSEMHVETLVNVATRKTRLAKGQAKAFVKREQKELALRDADTPEAKAEQDRREKAEVEAAGITKRIEAARLYGSCKSIAKSATLLDDLVRVVHRLGVVGEDASIAGEYLACTSRLLKLRAISHLRRGAAASGKNFLITMTLRFFPESCVILISSATPMALIYYSGDGEDDEDSEDNIDVFAHKIVVIAEAAVLAKKANGDEHPMTGMLRILLSEGQLDHYIPLPQGNGKLKTKHIRRNGPIVLLLTSARENIEPEMLTRLLTSDADESSGQTMRVIENILAPSLTQVEQAEIDKWIDFQKWLECDAPYEVIVPFQAANAFTIASEHWEDRTGVVLGVVTLDQTDHDFGFVALLDRRKGEGSQPVDNGFERGGLRGKRKLPFRGMGSVLELGEL